MRMGMIDKHAIRQRWEAVGSTLDERGRLLFAAGEVLTAGRGGPRRGRGSRGWRGRRSVAGAKTLRRHRRRKGEYPARVRAGGVFPTGMRI